METKTLALTAAAPHEIRTLVQAEAAVEWLRAKRDFDASVDEAYSSHIKAAHKAHKDLLATAKKIKEASDRMALEVRARLESFAEHTSIMPEGTYKRDYFNVYITDPKLVPDIYKAPDMALIKTFVKHTGGAIPIDGVAIEKEVRVTVQGDDYE